MTRLSPSKRTSASRCLDVLRLVTELRQARYCVFGDSEYRERTGHRARVAASPSGIVSGTRSKSAVLIVPISTSMRTSFGPIDSQLQCLVGIDHHVHRAAEQLRRALQVQRIRRRFDQIHDDDHVGAQVARNIDRECCAPARRPKGSCRP